MNGTTDESGVRAVDLFGPSLTFLTALPDAGDGYSLMEGRVPAGGVIPLHAHPDRETFYLVDGRLEGFQGGVWRKLAPGDVFDIAENVRHAFRNTSHAPALVLAVTSARLARFMRRAGRPFDGVHPGPPSETDLRRFADLAQEENMWLGNPEDNAAIGIDLGYVELAYTRLADLERKQGRDDEQRPTAP